MKHVLIVDDVSTNLKCVDFILKNQYKVSMLKSGAEAIAFMEKEIPDLLLLDIHMHGMNGYEVMEWMNTHLAAAQIPVILLTADTDRESEKQGRALGAIGFIKKPFEPGRLLECVNRILNTEA